MSTKKPSQQLNDLLVSRDFDTQLLNKAGKPADPQNADVISFDYNGESGKDYGTVAIMLGDGNSMDVYFGDNLGKSMEKEDKKSWFDFLYQLRQFAKRNLLSFNLANLNKIKYSMTGQAALAESLFESWQGNKTQSWTKYPNDVRLVIKHSKTITENDKRYRYIQALFLETAEGERFKLPFTKLAGGRAMVEHVKQGGKPYDLRGQHIAEMVSDINTLAHFKRASRNKIFEGETGHLVETATQYYESLKKNLGALSSSRGYGKYFESWNPAEITQEELIIEDLKGLFVTQQIDTRIERALPLLAKLQQQENNMKELSIFEGWVGLIAEGTWALPDTPEKQTKLVELLSKDFPVGADATNATEELYDILGDDDLFDALKDLAKKDPDAPCNDVIKARLQELSDNNNVAKVLGKLTVEEVPPEEEEKIEIEKEVTEDYDREADVRQIADEYIASTGIGSYDDLTAEDIDYIAGEAQCNYEGICDILGIPCPEELGPVQSWDYDEEGNKVDLEEHGSGVENMHGKSWQSSRAKAHPWNANESEELDEGAMKDMLWKMAERMERDEFVNHCVSEWGWDPEEMGEFWDSCCGEVEEGTVGAVLGGAAGAAATKSVGGAMTGAKIGSAIGDAIGEDSFGSQLARMQSLAMIK